MALARSAPRWRSRGGLRIPGQAPRRKDGVGHTERPACNSRIRDLGVVYPPKPVSAGTQGHGALQYQWLMRLKPTWFRHDLLTLFDLLQRKKITPLIAQRLPLRQARHAHELLGSGGVIGKIVLVPNG